MTESRIKECEICGATFAVTSRYGRNRMFCSEACQDKAKQARLDRQKFKRAIKKRPQCICVVCGDEYKSIKKQSRNNRYCSAECQSAAQLRHPHTCPECGVRFHGLRGAIFCGLKCASAVGGRKAALLIRAKADERQRKKDQINKEKRKLLAKGLRLWRSGLSSSEAAIKCGFAESSGTSFLGQSKRYARVTKARLEKSQWHKIEVGRNAKSARFKTERGFSDYAVQEMGRWFECVEAEVRVPGSLRRIDLIVSSGLFRFGVELKATCRTARLDQLLGQALVKSAAMNVIPVCAIPDDLEMDFIFVNACKSLGVIAGTLSDAINDMRQAACIASPGIGSNHGTAQRTPFGDTSAV